MRRFFFILFTLTLTWPSTGQDTLLRESTEDFRRSQDRRELALKAFSAGDFRTALRLMQRASKLRPTHAGLILARLRLAVAASDLDAVMAAATDYQALGLPLDDGVMGELSKISDSPLMGGIAAQNDRLSAPKGSAEVVATIPAEYQLVESIVEDDDGRLYATTVVSRQIIRQDDDGGWSVLFDGRAAGYPSFFGITADDGYITASYAVVDQTPDWDGPPITGVITVNGESGDIDADRRLEISDDNPAQLGDMAESGVRVAVSDAATGQVYLVEDDNLRPLFDAGRQIINPQGLTKLPPYGSLVADFSRGIWSFQENQRPQLLAWPRNQSVLGIDGLTAYNGALYAVQNGVQPNRVLKLTVADPGITQVDVVAQGLDIFNESTSLAVTSQGLLMVAQSQWPTYGVNGQVRSGMTPTTTAIVRIAD